MKMKFATVSVVFVLVFAMMAAVDLGFDFVPKVSGVTIYVDDDGGADYTSIQAAIDVANPGDTVYVFSGNYIENVIVDKTINLTGEANTTTIIDGSWGYGLDIVHITADYVNISNFYITNQDNPDTGGYGDGIKVDSKFSIIFNNVIYGGVYGIYLNPSSSNSTIESNTVTYSWYWAIYGDSSDGNIIKDNTVDTNGDSIYLSYGTEMEIFDNTIRYNSLSGIYLSYCTNSNVYSNSLYDNGDGIVLGASSGITVSDNLIWDDHPSWFCANGLALYNSDGNHIINNNASESGYGLLMDYSDGNNIAFNDFLYCSNGGIQITHSSNNSIRGINVINSMIGLTLHDSQNNNITCSKFSTFYGGPGMSIDSSNGNNIAWNTIYESMWGLNLLACSANEIANNIFKDNTNPFYGWAIHLEDSHDNIVEWNNITNNDYGVYLLESGLNTISSNHIEANDNGIHSESSGNNIIYHNNIIDNTQQAYDDGESNIWNDSYPSGGNYWSDYLGNDLFQGPGQNISGSDGIGDTNYTIDTNSTDHYPLMNPHKENHTILKHGWNLISIPLIPDDTSLEYVLESISGKYDAVQWYNCWDTNEPWKHFKMGKPFGNDLTQVNETIGFWIHITEPCKTMFFYNGSQPLINQNIPLRKGWNLVGYPSITNHNRTMGLNNLTFGTEVDAIQWFDSITKTWHFLEEGDSFEVGRGYWFHTKTDCTWEVPL